MNKSKPIAIVARPMSVVAVLFLLPLLVGTVSAQQITGKVTCSDTTPATPLAGISVIATNLQGGFTSGLTDSNGNYSITVSATIPTPYEVRLGSLPSGLSLVEPAGGSFLRLVPIDTTPANFVLTGCGEEPASGEIGDRVWEDLNCNGLQDADEPGMAGVTVTLTDCEGLVVLAETTTDADGLYQFANLNPGDYALHFVAPPGYTFSPMNQGSDAGLDSDVDPMTGATMCITLEAGQIDLTWDGGLCKLEAPGVRSQGYWKTHPEAWPVEDIEIGGTTYKKCEAIPIMRQPTQGNKWLNLFEQLVAAKLNVYAGNESDCIEDTILDSDQWLERHPGPVRANSLAWKCAGRYLQAELDDYNNGDLCAPPAD